jgi:hypothetical protein
VVPCLLAGLLACAACHKTDETPATNTQGTLKGSPPSPIHEAMVRLSKGPDALVPKLGVALRSEAPPWATIQTESKEVAQLASSLAQYEPPVGSKASWAKLTAEYARTAETLDQAAQAKDRDAALAAHKALGDSCLGCHKAHKPQPSW